MILTGKAIEEARRNGLQQVDIAIKMEAERGGAHLSHSQDRLVIARLISTNERYRRAMARGLGDGQRDIRGWNRLEAVWYAPERGDV